jgi:sugar phosphate isomerase/epimerase
MLRIGTSLFGVGVLHSAAYSTTAHDPVSTTLRLLEDPNLQAVEGSWTLLAAAQDKIRAAIAYSGADVVFTVGGIMRRKGIDPSAADAKARESAVAELRKVADIASGLGCRMMLICSGPDKPPAQRKTATGYLRTALEELCAHAVAIRPDDPMWITFEHFDRELHQKRLLGPTVEAAELIREVRKRHSNIGLTLDLSHIVQLGEDIAGAVETARDVTIHVHVANCGLDRSIPVTFGDSHCRFGAPGGAIDVEDVKTFLLALSRTGYGAVTVPTRLPIISVEMKTPEGEPPELAIAAGLRTLKHAAALADIAADPAWID